MHGHSLEIVLPKRIECKVCLGSDKDFHNSQQAINSGEKFVVDETLYSKRKVERAIQ